MTSESNPPGATGSPPASRRRVVATGLVAGIAAAAGLGVGWWKYGQSIGEPTLVPVDASEPNSARAQADAAQKFWQTVFDTPSGAKLPMSSFRGNPLLVNFWATWCPPCVEELPLINAFYQENKSKSWQVVGIAADQLKSVKDFMVKLPLGFPVGLAGLAGIELSKSLGNLAGGLPFTVVFGRDGTVRHRQLGRITAEHLAAWRSLE